MAKPITIKLQTPISFGSQRFEELTFKPVTARHLRELRASPDRPLGMAVELAALLSGQVQEVIDQLEGEDLSRVLEVTTNFLEVIQPPGATLSDS